jgi:hypothetical protein
MHTPGTWTLGDVQEWVVASLFGDASRAERAVARLLDVARADGLLPEAYDPATGGAPIRPWFAWPSAALGWLLLRHGGGHGVALGPRIMPPVDDPSAWQAGTASTLSSRSPSTSSSSGCCSRRFLSGRYGSGGRLPTEHELCALFGISRTPVNRAPSELADEGVILRRRRHGTFVNPHWLRRNADGPELRVLVPEGPWERQIRAAADVRLSVARVTLPELHNVLTRAVAEGRGPDLAVIDSVWVAELATAGFLWPLDELDRRWVADEYEADFLEPFVTANRHAEHPVAIQAEADVAGIWYRRSELEAVGFAPPATWDELLALGRALAARGRQPLALPAGSRAGETAAYCLLALLASNGATVLDGDRVTLDTPAAVEAMALLVRLADEDILSPDVVAYEWDRPIKLLAHGEAALSVGGSYEGPALAAQSGLEMDALWRTTPSRRSRRAPGARRPPLRAAWPTRCSARRRTPISPCGSSSG